MSSRRVMLIGGGVRSGKSAFALKLARELGERRLFVATAQTLDDEMRTRAENHVQERGTAFATLEVPLELSEALVGVASAGRHDVVVIDCLTFWLANLVMRGDDMERVQAQVQALCEVIFRRSFHCVMVTNEVGMGVVPDTSLGRIFRDVVGRAHQRIARDADELYFAMLGTMLRLRPEPMGAVATEVTR